MEVDELAIMNKSSPKRFSTLLNARLTKLMREKNFTIIKLSEQTGVAVGTIQKMQVDPTCNPTLSSLSLIAKALKTTVGYLIGQTNNRSTLEHKIINVYDLKHIKIDSLYTAENFVDALGSPIDTASVTIPISNKSFALKMWDDSMSPLFVKNNLLVFDLKQKWKHGSYVLVKLANHELPLLRQLILTDKKQMLYSHSHITRKETGITLTTNDHILATLVQAQLG